MFVCIQQVHMEDTTTFIFLFLLVFPLFNEATNGGEYNYTGYIHYTFNFSLTETDWFPHNTLIDS